MSLDGLDADSSRGGQHDPRDRRQRPGHHGQPVVADRETAELDAGRYQAAVTGDVKPLGTATGTTTDPIHIPTYIAVRRLITGPPTHSVGRPDE